MKRISALLLLLSDCWLALVDSFCLIQEQTFLNENERQKYLKEEIQIVSQWDFIFFNEAGHRVHSKDSFFLCVYIYSIFWPMLSPQSTQQRVVTRTCHACVYVCGTMVHPAPAIRTKISIFKFCEFLSYYFAAVALSLFFFISSSVE